MEKDIKEKVGEKIQEQKISMLIKMVMNININRKRICLLNYPGKVS